LVKNTLIHEKAHLNIIPLGAVEELAVSVVAANLQTMMGLNTDIRPGRIKPEYAYQHGRRQYDAGKIINALASDNSNVPLTLGITGYDLSTPILTFVYGESQLGGRAALISLYRITDENTEVTCTRAAKIGLHEVGHLLGIGHCRAVDCLMCFSASLENLDQLQLRFAKPASMKYPAGFVIFSMLFHELITCPLRPYQPRNSSTSRSHPISGTAP